MTGASFTGVTVMLTVSVSLRAPSRLWSLVVRVKLAAPLKLSLGWKVSPFRAVLMAPIVPVKTRVGSSLPLPVVKLSPAVPFRVRLPLVALSVTCTGLLPAFTSLTAIRLPVRVEKTKALSSATSNDVRGCDWFW